MSWNWTFIPALIALVGRPDGVNLRNAAVRG
jgi:hypothetical protein